MRAFPLLSGRLQVRLLGGIEEAGLPSWHLKVGSNEEERGTIPWDFSRVESALHVPSVTAGLAKLSEKLFPNRARAPGIQLI